MTETIETTETTTATVWIVTERTPQRVDYLRANGRLSLAEMYVRDLERGVDFGRMVDGRGSPFHCSPSRWAAFILKIAEECKELAPERAAAVLARLLAYDPEATPQKYPYPND